MIGAAAMPSTDATSQLVVNEPEEQL